MTFRSSIAGGKTPVRRQRLLLALNIGSSSIKFGVFTAADEPEPVVAGGIPRSGGAPDWVEAVTARLAGVAKPAEFAAMGHRVVHGGPLFDRTVRANPHVLAALRRLIPLAPEHQEAELALLEETTRRWPKVPQFACFDTAFFRNLPPVARHLPIPRRYRETGVQRYGFHGLSYAYLLRELARLRDPAARHGRVIFAHLGSGASLAAVRNGACQDTTMGYTPAGGLMMATRPGDLDPGVLLHLLQCEEMSPPFLDRLIHEQCGLLGVSETTADLGTLLLNELTDERAAEAVALYCHQLKKALGAMVAVLNGLDTLVFSGGVGEHAPAVRSRACAGLGFLGVRLDEKRNFSGEGLISSPASKVSVRVIPTREEEMIAREVAPLMRRPTADEQTI